MLGYFVCLEGAEALNSANQQTRESDQTVTGWES